MIRLGRTREEGKRSRAVLANQIYPAQGLRVGGQGRCDPSVGGVGGAPPVEGVKGLAVVLQADAVDVKKRNTQAADFFREYAVAFLIFPLRERRAAEVDQKIAALAA